jgi:uncharacterized phage protein gp47/JayE
MNHAWGLTEEGFKAKDMPSIKADLEEELLKEVNPTLNFGPGTIAGQLTAIVSNQARQVWEAAQALYSSLNPDTAFGSSLDALCKLTGTYRNLAQQTKIKAMLTLKENVCVAKDSCIRTVGGDIFRLVDEVKNSSNTLMQKEGEFIAEDSGPIMAHGDTPAQIITPVAGWSSAIIKETLGLGCLRQTDDDLRRTRLVELRAKGSSSYEGIHARLMKVDKVEAVHIKEYERGFEVILKGGEDEQIAYALWECKPLGIPTFGQTTFTVIDPIVKQKRFIRFSRPEMVNLSLHIKLKVRRLLNEEELTALKNTFANHGKNHFKLGGEVYPSRFYSAVLDHSQVLDVSELLLRDKITGNPVPTVIKANQIASLSFNDIFIDQKVEVPS